MRKNKQCACCSTQYAYCPDCGGPDRLKPSWYSEFCCEDCKDLWMIATQFNMGMIEKNDAREMILSLNLKDRSEYAECVQRDIENILKDDEAPKKRGKRAEMLIFDEAISEAEKPTVHEVVTTENE